MAEITVRKVEHNADYNVFFEFPWNLYKDSPYWVPPLKSTRHQTLNREKDASWAYMEGDYFIAWRGAEAVGTIAAFVNHRHNETWNENIAWFGAFEFIDDATVARLLLETAETWAREHGYDAVRGPATFTLHAEVGVLIDPFDRPPLILMPYNFAYYPRHIEAAGYHVEKRLGTWTTHPQTYLDVPEAAERMEKAARLAKRAMERQNITWRKGNPRNRREDFDAMYQIYNTGWNANWGFVPLTDREFEGLMDELGAIYDPNKAFYVYKDGEPAAFLVAVPDMNQAFLHAYPRPGEVEIVSMLKVLWHWKIRPKIDTLRFPLGGISRKHHSSGVIAVGVFAFLEIFLKNDPPWREYDGGWVLEDNDNMNAVLRKLTVNEGRTYHIYQKNL